MSNSELPQYELSVATLNCFDSPLSTNRVPRIKRAVKELVLGQVDIICLQEIIFPTTLKAVTDILEACNYQVITNKQGIINKGGLLCAFLNPKLRVIDSQFSCFRNQGHILSQQITDKMLRKGFQKINLQVYGKRIHIFNTHLVSVYKRGRKPEEEVQTNQYQQLAGAINSESGATVVCGDFNFSPASRAYSKFLKMTGMTDALENKGAITVSVSNSHRKYLYKIKYNERLDYILSSEDIKVVDSYVTLDGPYKMGDKEINLSDHYGLYVKLRL